MGDLSQSRISTVRRLLEAAPDNAVQSLESFLNGDPGAEAPSDAVRVLINAEREDRRLRNAMFSPFAPVFGSRRGLSRINLPADMPGLLWRALKAHDEPHVASAAARFASLQKHSAPDDAHPHSHTETAGHTQSNALHPSGHTPSNVHLIAHSHDHSPSQNQLMSDAILNALCADAAAGLEARVGDYAGIIARFDSRPDDLRTLILLLKLAPQLRVAVSRLPYWLTARAGEFDTAVRDLVDAAEAQDIAQGGAFAQQAGPLFMEVVLAHLQPPAHILRLIAVVMDHPTDRLFAACEYASFGERLLDDVDTHIESIRAFDPRRGLEGGIAVASASTTAHVTLTEFEHNLTLIRDGIWGGRIAMQRRNLALMMEMRLREVEGAVSAALPAAAIRMSGKLMRGAADLSRPPQRRMVDRAVGLIALAEGCRPSAALAGYGAIRARVLETLDSWLHSYIQEVLERLHKEKSKPEGAAGMDRMYDYLDIAIEFTAMIQGADAADLIRRRVAAA